MTPEDRREAIVDATRRVMVRQGIAATTVRDVAAEMGTSSGLIHHYFGSMDDLLAEAFDALASADLASTREALMVASDPVERLAIFLVTYNRSDESWSVQLWLDAWSEASRRPALRRTSRRLNEAWQRLVAELINDGVMRDVMRCDDPGELAWRLVSLLDGLALQTVAHDDLMSRSDASRWAREYAERELSLPAGALLHADVPRSTPMSCAALRSR
jgi:AcrR family transcriptional regulator